VYLHGRYACIGAFAYLRYIYIRAREFGYHTVILHRRRLHGYESGIKRHNKNHMPCDLSAAAAAVRCFQQRRTLRLRNGRCSSARLRNGKKLCNVPAKSLRPQLRRRTSRVSERDYRGRNNT